MSNQHAVPDIVFVIDDEQAARQQLERLLREDDVRSLTFHSLVRFLDWLDYDRLPANAVIAAEISMPELGGFDLLNILQADAVFAPTILMGKS